MFCLLLELVSTYHKDVRLSFAYGDSLFMCIILCHHAQHQYIRDDLYSKQMKINQSPF